MLSLSWALAERGHEVTFVAARDLLSDARAAGIPCAALPLDVRALLSEAETRRMFARGDLPGLFARFVQEEALCRDEFHRAIVDAARGADAVVATGLAVDVAAVAGAAARIPVVPVYFAPLLPSSSFPSPFVSARPTLGPFNRATHDLVFRARWRSKRTAIAALRRDLRVAPIDESLRAPGAAPRIAVPAPLQRRARREAGRLGTLDCHDRREPHALRAPREAWGERAAAGFWRAGSTAARPRSSSASAACRCSPRFLPVAREVVGGLGLRAVVATGWSPVPAGHDDTVFTVAEVDHNALFARCAAAVHHGGAGTTHEGLRAGLPTIVCSVFGDQRFWGARCRALGVGDTLRFSKVTARALSKALQRALHPSTRSAARDLGSALAGEDGLAAAVHVIQSLPRAAWPE